MTENEKLLENILSDTTLDEPEKELIRKHLAKLIDVDHIIDLTTMINSIMDAALRLHLLSTMTFKHNHYRTDALSECKILALPVAKVRVYYNYVIVPTILSSWVDDILTSCLSENDTQRFNDNVNLLLKLGSDDLYALSYMYNRYGMGYSIQLPDDIVDVVWLDNVVHNIIQSLPKLEHKLSYIIAGMTVRDLLLNHAIKDTSTIVDDCIDNISKMYHTKRIDMVALTRYMGGLVTYVPEENVKLGERT